MSECVSVLIVGIGGYGSRYANALLDRADKDRFSLAGVVDLAPANYSRLTELRARSIPIYGTMEDFYTANRADLAVIATPIHFHAAQTCLAMAHGSHVLCEKPISATIQEALGMADYRDRADRFVAISFGQVIQALKRDIMTGRFGRAKRLKTLVLWPRSKRYFGRSWAGKKSDGRGRWILDSIANNAAAHSAQDNRGHGELEMTALCQYTLTNQVFGTVSLDYLRPESAPTHGDDRIRLAGTRGALEVRDGRACLINDSTAGPQELPLPPGGRSSPIFWNRWKARGLAWSARRIPST